MIPKQALELLKISEGLRLLAYPDPGSSNGLPATIGYGHTKGVKIGDNCTEAQANTWLEEDAIDALNNLKQEVPTNWDKLNANQLSAIISWEFNLGDSLTDKSTLYKVLNTGNFVDIPDELRKWVYNDSKIMPGLVNRRNSEIALWNTPVSSRSEGSTGPSGTNPDSPSQHWLARLVGSLINFLVKMFLGKK